MRPDPRTEAEVTQVLARIVDVIGRRDAEGALALFADDLDVFLYGTGVDEARKGRVAIRAQIERDLCSRMRCLGRWGSRASPRQALLHGPLGTLAFASLWVTARSTFRIA